MQKFEHVAKAAPLVPDVPAEPPIPLLGAPATPTEPPVAAAPATPVLVASPATPMLAEPPVAVLVAPALVAGAVPLDEPLMPLEAPAGTELLNPGSSPAVKVDVRPPQPAIIARHTEPNQTRDPEKATAIR